MGSADEKKKAYECHISLNGLQQPLKDFDAEQSLLLTALMT
jgi:hypothetical protein